MPTIQELLGQLGQTTGRSYPTKDEIIGSEHKHKPTVIKTVKQWKREVWREVKTQGIEQKFEALSGLLHKLSEIYRKPITVRLDTAATSCSYNPANSTITINESLSIISTLHEFAHHIFGSDETKACRWSVWLFKKTFKKAYEQLEWQGHMLIKRASL